MQRASIAVVNWSRDIATLSIELMDWDALRSSVHSGDTEIFLQLVSESLQFGNKQFGILQKGLRAHCFQQAC